MTVAATSAAAKEMAAATATTMAAASTAPAAATPPGQSLYINNLNDRIKKKELRESLYYLFSQYGRVIDVVALKTMKMRGQAFVVLDTIPAATVAMRELQGFPLYDKNMQIGYAKTKSNAVKLREGSYSKKRRAAANAEVDMESDDDNDNDDAPRKHRPGASENGAVGGRHLKDNEEEMEEEDSNAILYVTQLPPSVTEESLSALFGQNDGFKEVRVVPGRADIAFVEFSSAAEAEQARTVLNGFKISPNQAMRVDFARR
ncbi:hypothetical protein BASA50_005351 [Batrachochytrium salamandrivorans]|uniref:RRM domain-containing protein n=1 Tax=Batrachochytrium salamandrivorans TaxID=1357716 RepID=A0ABQ8FD81_9FUNG|nr:hypothetical protein BASA50_005351 [Batrachochytrium salamandrivorans]KAH9273822.1 hypothetical protein BASA83_003816 [Batrachochytrium salamandrivorans]